MKKDDRPTSPRIQTSAPIVKGAMAGSPATDTVGYAELPFDHPQRGCIRLSSDSFSRSASIYLTNRDCGSGWLDANGVNAWIVHLEFSQAPTSATDLTSRLSCETEEDVER